MILSILLLVFSLLLNGPRVSHALNQPTPPDDTLWTRRDALSVGVGATTAAATVVATTLYGPGTASAAASSVIAPMESPPPNLNWVDSAVVIPRVGYSLYKTQTTQVERCTALALRAGVRHLDVATQYGSNAQVGKVVQRFLHDGLKGLEQEYHVMSMSDEKETNRQRVATVYDTAARRTQERLRSSSSSPGAIIQSKRGLLEQLQLTPQHQQRRREELFLSHKLSNDEQSEDPEAIQRSVQRALDDLLGSKTKNDSYYLDMVSIHSPLTTPSRRLATYRSLLALKDAGMIRAVGVCNYGLGPLQDIVQAGLPLPTVNQLELSPFHTHGDVIDWCADQGVAVSCAAWSRLSSADGPVEQWEVVSRLAQAKQMTKAQVLVRWALQKGYLCVPRSTCASKVERLAIAENSYGGVMTEVKTRRQNPSSSSSFMLTADEMKRLDGLNVNFKAGRLGRRDGWSDADVTGTDWDPTEVR